jgi:hypothetical protein
MQIINSSYLDTGLYYVGLSMTDGGTTTWDWSDGTVRVWSASSLGVVSGIVKDVALAPLADIQAEIISPSRIDSSLSDGAYRLSQIFPGTYSVRFSGTGFADTTINNVVVTAADTTELNIVMRTFCAYLPGDVNGNNLGPTINDVVYLVSFLFQSGPQPPNMNAADVNGNSTVTIADLVYLVAFLFSSGPPPHCP